MIRFDCTLFLLLKLSQLPQLYLNIQLINYQKNKLVGRAESIHPQRKWRYGFSHYTTGRVGDFSVFEKASTEARGRTLARTVPRSR